MSDFVLTAENYYTPKADRQYMSCSQYQAFMDCEAKALAVLDGRWPKEDKEAFLVGNYFHSYFESPEAHRKFCEEHFDDIFKTKVTKARGVEVVGKYAPYELADKMILTAESAPKIKHFIDMPGEHEMMMCGKIWGVPWKIKLDKYIPDHRTIIDYKTCANIHKPEWNPVTRQRETFVETFGYMMRAAVYCAIERQYTGADTNAIFMLICLSKQDPPDKEMILLNHEARFQYELELVKKNLPRIVRIKNHGMLPRRCGMCDYCRATKRITKIIPYYKLDPEFADEREEDYAAIPDDLEAVQKA